MSNEEGDGNDDDRSSGENLSSLVRLLSPMFRRFLNGTGYRNGVKIASERGSFIAGSSSR